MNQVEKCSIGQIERCRSTGCEWKKAFHEHCSTRKPELKVEKQQLKVEKQQVIKIASTDDWIKKIRVK